MSLLRPPCTVGTPHAPEIEVTWPCEDTVASSRGISILKQRWGGGGYIELRDQKDWRKRFHGNSRYLQLDSEVYLPGPYIVARSCQSIFLKPCDGWTGPPMDWSLSLPLVSSARSFRESSSWTAAIRPPGCEGCQSVLASFCNREEEIISPAGGPGSQPFIPRRIERRGPRYAVQWP